MKTPKQISVYSTPVFRSILVFLFLVASFTTKSQVKPVENKECTSIVSLGNNNARATISKEEFFKISKLDVINSCNKALKYQVLSYKVVLIKNNSPIQYNCNSAAIQPALQNTISQMNEGAKLFFTNIKFRNSSDSVVMFQGASIDSMVATHPSGTTEKIKGVLFTINAGATQTNALKKDNCDPTLSIGNYKGGSTITKEELSKVIEFRLLTSCKNTSPYKIVSIKITLKVQGVEYTYAASTVFPQEAKSMVYLNPSETKIFFENVKVKNSDSPIKNINGTTLIIKAGPFTDTVKHESAQNIEAKLLYGPKKNIPLSHHKVYLTSNKGDTLKKTETNDFGDFEFRDINAGNSNIVIGSNDKITNEEIYLAKQNGIIISKFTKTKGGFTYKLLPADIIKLNPINVEDSELKLNDFAKSKDKTITIAENIYYGNNEYKLNPESKKKIDLIANTLKKNADYKLEIYAHTDSRGEDASNLELSNKRSAEVLEYLASTGIDKARLVAKGMGETKIMNRCTNGETCSEKEHELNRRTEFKFIKK